MSYDDDDWAKANDALIATAESMLPTETAFDESTKTSKRLEEELARAIIASGTRSVGTMPALARALKEAYAFTQMRECHLVERETDPPENHSWPSDCEDWGAMEENFLEPPEVAEVWKANTYRPLPPILDDGENWPLEPIILAALLAERL